MHDHVMKDRNEQGLWASRLAKLLDHEFEGPLGIRLGYDGLLGLIPGIGDVITTGLGLLIVGQAIILGASPIIILRMLINLLIDNVLAKIPILGLIIDFFWRANSKNMRLLNHYNAKPGESRRASILYILMWITIVLTICILFFMLTTYLLILVWNRIY